MKSNLTVIVPNYNNAFFLQQCIESIYKQTVLPEEVIVVDDCSTDNSIDVLKKLSKKFVSLKVVILDKNEGVSNARNVGINKAKTDYITFLDSDDFNVNPKKYENELKLIKACKHNALVYSEIVHCDINGNLTENSKHNHKKNMSGKCTNRCIAVSGFTYGPFDYIVKKDLVKRVGCFSFNRNLYEDLDLLIRLSFVCKFYPTNQIGRAYRHTNSGLSKARASEHELALRSIFDTYYWQMPIIGKVHVRFLRLLEKIKLHIYKRIHS